LSAQTSASPRSVDRNVRNLAQWYATRDYLRRGAKAYEKQVKTGKLCIEVEPTSKQAYLSEK
jgi:hypothetical protein